MIVWEDKYYYETTRQMATTDTRLATLRPKPPRKAGRPPKLTPPPLPDFDWPTPYESEMYEYAMAAILADYTDMKPSDMLNLPLIAAEYVKYLRWLASEVAAGESISITKQHPGQMYVRLLETLGATRKQRTRNAEPEKNEFDFSAFNAG